MHAADAPDLHEGLITTRAIRRYRADDIPEDGSRHVRGAVMERHHRIDYVEFAVTDLVAAKAFYGAAFGWEFTDYGDAYVGIRSRPDGREAGGFTRVDEPHGGGPLVILYSDDIEASVRAVRDAGGTISIEAFDFPGGRRFHFVDPFGNELAVWTETSH
jgi:predicted enzyme related to lactoylglutathione lyase